MKLFSCEDCGIVYDMDRISIPDNDEYDSDNPEDWHWIGDGFVPVFKCKVCNGRTPIIQLEK